MKTIIKKYTGWLILALLYLASIVIDYSSNINLIGLGLWVISLSGLLFLVFKQSIVSENQTLDIKNISLQSLKNINKLDLIIFLAILSLGIFLRLYKIETLPFGIWLDEGYTARNAIQLLEGTIQGGFFGFTPLVNDSFHLDWVKTSNLYLFYVFCVIKTFNFSFLGLKMISILPAIGIVAGSFFLYKLLFDSKYVAFLGMFFMAVSQWSLTIDRWGWDEVLMSFLQVVTYALILYGIKSKNHFSFALAGTFMGLSLYTYIGSRIVLLIILLFFIIASVRNIQFFKDYKKGIFLFFALVLLTFGPTIPYFIKDPASFMVRVNELSPMESPFETQNLPTLVDRTVKHLLMFNIRGDSQVRHNFSDHPQMDIITGWLFVIGFLYILWNWKNKNNYLLLIWFVLGLSGGILSTFKYGAPHAYRTALLIPLVYCLSALGLFIIFNFLSGLYKDKFAKIKSLILYILTIAIIITVGYLNIDQYFVKYPVIALLRQQAEPLNESIVALRINDILKKDKNIQIFADKELVYTHAIMEYLTYNINKSTDKNFKFKNAPVEKNIYLLPDPQKVISREIVYIFKPTKYIIVKTLFPQIPLIPVKDYSNQTIAYIIKLKTNLLNDQYGFLKADKKNIYAGSFYNDYNREYYIAKLKPDIKLWINDQPVFNFDKLDATIRIVEGNAYVQIKSMLDPDKLSDSILVVDSYCKKTLVAYFKIFKYNANNDKLLAKYFDNTGFKGKPEYVTYINSLDNTNQIPLGYQNNYGIIYKGYLKVLTTGNYRFRSRSEGGSCISIDGKIVVDNRGNHGPETVDSKIFFLEEGFHEFELKYSRYMGANIMELFWQVPEDDNFIPLTINCFSITK